MDFLLLSWATATTKTSVHYLPSTAIPSWRSFHKQCMFSTSDLLTFPPTIRSGFVLTLLRQKLGLLWRSTCSLCHFLFRPYCVSKSLPSNSPALHCSRCWPFLAGLPRCTTSGDTHQVVLYGFVSGVSWVLQHGDPERSAQWTVTTLFKKTISLGFPFPRTLALSLLELFKTLNEATLPALCVTTHNLPKLDPSLQVLPETYHFQDLESLIPISLPCFQTGEFA